MAIRTQEELLTNIRGLLADDTSDESLSLLEDVSDTFNNLSSNNDNEDWKKRYEENDKEWRKKYRDRFFNTGSEYSDDKGKSDDKEQEKPAITKFEDLFTVKE